MKCRLAWITTRDITSTSSTTTTAASFAVTALRYCAALAILVVVSGCSRSHKHDRKGDQNSPAYKVGEAAHEVAKHAERTAAAAEREIKENARKAAEGWKAKDKEDRDNH